MTSVFAGIFIVVTIAYSALVFFLYGFQRHLIYHPQKPIQPPAEYGLSSFAEDFIKSPDNETLQLWYREATDGFPTVIYFHGNATNMGTRAAIFKSLSALGFGVLALSYRGYGKSSGSPSETGLYNDARSSIAYLLQQKHIPLHRIIIYGESLGTGVAVQMTTEFDIAALVLQAPYTSVAARAAEIYYYAPVNWLIKDSFNSLAKITSIRAPLLLFHGAKDDTIPIAHAKTLFDAAIVAKQSVFFDHIGHNDFDSSVISEHVLNFSRAHNIL
jgi:fermentation-respiration switch protein FrsA (DUF1100 family)